MIEQGISTIIPNYNGRNLLPLVLPSLQQALKNCGLQYEIIVVDDGSTDDSVVFLKEQYPEVTVLKNRINKGFSVSMNKGVVASKFSLLFFLNSDVKVTPTYFETLIPYFNLPDTFGVMGKIISWDDDTIQDGGKYPYFQFAKIKTSGNYIATNPSNGEKFYSMYLSGANALVSREKVMKLQGFDEIFSPYYVEDYELSLRAWRLGWKCYYDHFAICRHKISVTIKSSASKKFVAKIYNRNKMFLHAIHLHGALKAIWYLQLFFEMIIRTVTFKWYYLKAIGLFIKGKKQIELSKRNFEALSFRTGVNKTVREVITKISLSLHQKEIQRF